MKKQALILLVLLFSCIYMSCDNMNHEEREAPFDELVNENMIGEQEAITSARLFLNNHYLSTKSQADRLIPDVQVVYRPISVQSSQQTVSLNANEDFENIPVYIINFKTEKGESKGFVVEVGDKRVSGKVLAFCDSGMWDMSGLPEFEHIFFEQTDYFISKSITENSMPLVKDIDPCDTGFFQEITKTTTKKCAMNITWGQSPSPYNDSLPICASTSLKDPAGCVAIAIAQIMAYHQKPTSGSYIHPVNMKTRNTTYSWSGMKSVADAKNLTNNTYRSQVANLLAEIGDKCSMSYGCDGSGSNIYYAYDAFTLMGYNVNMLISPYDFSKVKSDLDSSRPVYMRGVRAGGVGHAWVVEGYQTVDWAEIMVRECPGNPIEESYTGETGTNYYLYFNLGWNGSSNGYYLVSTQSASTSGTFLYTSDMMTMTNIKPI